MGSNSQSKGARDLFQRLSDGVTERAAALTEVERNEYAEPLRLARAIIP